MFKPLFSPKNANQKHIQSANNLHNLQSPSVSNRQQKLLQKTTTKKVEPLEYTKTNPIDLFIPYKRQGKDQTNNQTLKKEIHKESSKRTFLQLQFLKGKTRIRQKKSNNIEQLKKNAYEYYATIPDVDGSQRHHDSNSSDSCRSQRLFFMQNKKNKNKLTNETISEKEKIGSESADLANIIKPSIHKNNVNGSPLFFQGTKKKMYSPYRIFSLKDQNSVMSKPKKVVIDHRESVQSKHQMTSPVSIKSFNKTAQKKNFTIQTISPKKFSQSDYSFSLKNNNSITKSPKNQFNDYKLELGDPNKNLSFKRFNSEIQKTSTNSNKRKLVRNQSTFNDKKKIAFHQQKNTLKPVKFIETFKLFKKVNTPQYKSSNKMILFNKQPNSLHEAKSQKGKKYHDQFAKKFTNNLVMKKQNSNQSQNKSQTKQLILTSVSESLTPKIYEFIILKVISENEKSSVILVLETISRAIYCLKLLKIKGETSLKQFIKQYKVQSFVNNPYSVKSFAAFQDQNNKQNVYLLMEYMEGKCLLDELKRNLLQANAPNVLTNEPLVLIEDKIEHIRNILYQLLNIISELHSLNIIHRDIKPANIFISNGNYKLGDYGSATFSQSQQCIGTLDYAAPQILLQKPYDNSIDIWSLGCIAYQMEVGYPPFFHQSHECTIKKVSELDYDKNKIRQPQLKDFIQKILHLNPKNRLSGNECLNHIFIKKSSLCNHEQ